MKRGTSMDFIEDGTRGYDPEFQSIVFSRGPKGFHCSGNKSKNIRTHEFISNWREIPFIDSISMIWVKGNLIHIKGEHDGLELN